MHNFRLFETLTGDPVEDVTIPEPYLGEWDTRLSGRGNGKHGFPLYGSGISRSLIRDISRGNKYTLAHLWGSDLVVYAGVIMRRRYIRRTHALELTTQELRAAYLNDRMLYGVPMYVPGGTVLTVTNRSHSGAVRAALTAVFANGPGWGLPIDLPADGSGSFSATWAHGERLKLEDHIAQIEQDGCEVFFRPYINGSDQLRYETVVQTKVQFGTTTTLDADGPDSPVLDLVTEDDYAREMTGLLGFGKGGLSAPTAWAGDISTAGISVRDTWRTYPDLEGGRLQNAVNTDFDVTKEPTEQWSFGVRIHPDGPATVLPGRKLSLEISDDPFILDGPHALRVIGLRGNLGYTVIPEVQYG